MPTTIIDSCKTLFKRFEILDTGQVYIGSLDIMRCSKSCGILGGEFVHKLPYVIAAAKAVGIGLRAFPSLE